MKHLFFISLLYCICLTAWSQVETTKDHIKEKQLVPNVNNEKFTDFAPSISADGKTLIFESDREKGWKLFQTNLLDDNSWSEPKSIERINEYGRKNDLIAGPSISYDGNELYFFGYFMLKSDSEDIFVSERLSDGWSEPKPLPAPINTDAYEGFPSISPDGHTLYFLRVNDENPEYVDEDGNQEFCFNIWSSTKDTMGVWSEPKMLPAPVNTGCERSPRILADGKTLIFSSIREGGQGMFDMYQTELNEDGTWTDPVALEYINTPENDMSPCISAAGDVIYYYTGKNIYQKTIPPPYRQHKNITLEGYIKNAMGEPMGTTLHIYDKASGKKITTIENNPSDGWYSVVLTEGIDYKVVYDSDNHASNELSFDLKNLEEYREEHHDIEMNNEIPIPISLKDKELKEGIAGTITVTNMNGDILYQSDEVMEVFSPSLKIGDRYVVSASAEGFVDEVDTLMVGKSVEESSIQLEPERVSVQLNVADLQGTGRVKSKIILRNKDRNETIEANSNQMVMLRNGDRYEVVATADGYFFTTQEVSTTNLKADETGNLTTDDIPLTPIKENASLVLKGIHFDTNSAHITDDSAEELNRIVDMIKANPGIVIEISAHTDDVGDENYNLNLSNDRALSVVQYLTSNGISKDFLRPVGYGMSKPSVPNDSDENRAKNRRVEMIILSL